MQESEKSQILQGPIFRNFFKNKKITKLSIPEVRALMYISLFISPWGNASFIFIFEIKRFSWVIIGDPVLTVINRNLNFYPVLDHIFNGIFKLDSFLFAKWFEYFQNIFSVVARSQFQINVSACRYLEVSICVHVDTLKDTSTRYYLVLCIF